MTALTITPASQIADFEGRTWFGDDLALCKSLIDDMIHNGDYGTHQVEVTTDAPGNPNETITVMYIPAAQRAGISNNGGTLWIDATSIDDAITAYRSGDLEGRQ